MHDAYRQRETALATAMNDRTDWEHATRRQRQQAIAADAELRRRHPGQPWPPLRSAEPDLQHDSSAIAPAIDLAQTSRRIEEPAAAHREFAGRLAERQSLPIPARDPGYADTGPAFLPRTVQGRSAILQPPQPQIEPSPWILEQVADRDRNLEAGG
jgi:hypothetical protein